MARNARPTAAKREREKALIERRQQKFARRQDAKTKKPSNESDAGDLKMKGLYFGGALRL